MLLLKEIAIIKVEGHSKRKDFESPRNALADHYAKKKGGATLTKIIAHVMTRKRAPWRNSKRQLLCS